MGPLGFFGGYIIAETPPTCELRHLALKWKAGGKWWLHG